MKRCLAVILAALLIAAMAGCQQSGTFSPADSSTVQSSADSSAAESAESEISEAQSSIVSEVTSTESSDEKSEASKTESLENKSKTESSKSKTEESSKKETSKAESSKAETSKTESSKSESSQTAEPKATGISIDSSTLSLTSGHTQELNAYILWSNGTQSYNGITWSSNNSSVASVNSTGYVTAKSAGTATITASYGSFKKTCTVTVKAASQPSGGSGSTGNSGSNNGGSGGQTSKPSGGNSGGSSGNSGTSSLTLVEKAKRAGFDLNVYNDARLKGVYWSRYGLPDNGIKFREVYPIQNFDKSARIKVESRAGNEVYEVPELLAQVNKRRALLGLSPVRWDGYTKENAEKTKKLYANMDEDQLQCVIDLHPSWFKDGKLTDWGVKELYRKSSTDACDSMDYALSHSLSHMSGGSNINASVVEFNAEEWIDGIENSPMHWSAIVDPNAETFYAIASPGPNGTYTLCIWCA